MIAAANDTQVAYVVRRVMVCGAMWGGPLHVDFDTVVAEAGHCLDAPDVMPSGACVSEKNTAFAGCTTRPGAQ